MKTIWTDIKNVFREYRVNTIYCDGKRYFHIVYRYPWQYTWTYLDGEYYDYEEASKILKNKYHFNLNE